MDEEMIKIKYRDFLNKLYIIKNKYEELDDAYDNLDSTIKNNMLIDDKILVQDEFEQVKQDINDLESTLINTIIPIVRNRT